MTDLSSARTTKPSEIVSQVLVKAVYVLIIGVLGIVSYATYTDRTPSAVAPEGNVVKSRMLVIESEHSGATKIFTIEGVLISDLTFKEGGFVASIDRSVRRRRTLANVTQGGPVLLTLDDLGRLKIADPDSGWSADLMAFGDKNIKAFAMLLD